MEPKALIVRIPQFIDRCLYNAEEYFCQRWGTAIVNLSPLTPAVYGSGPTASALPSLLTALEHLQTEGVLARLLDLNHIILGGHSAGDRVFTTGRPFLDFAVTQPEEQVRAFLAETIRLFIDAHVYDQPVALTRLNQYLGKPNALISSFDRK